LFTAVLQLPPQEANAVLLEFPALKDNTLLRYDPTDTQTSLNSNGSGNFFSAGRTLSRDEIRRGLIQFDLSSVPVNAQIVPGSVKLQLRVIGVPSNDSSSRPFWLAGLANPWGEGASTATFGVSGSGRGAPAQPGDATWFHTSYNPNIHNTTDFVSNGAGYWTTKGAISNTFIADPAAMFGAPAGIAGSVEGFIDFASPGMENDVEAWLANTATNFGWIVIGDEGVTGTNASSKRDFASREHVNPDFHPMLSFEVTAARIDGDYNDNGAVDAADYVLWRRGGPLLNEVDTPGIVNDADYTEWRSRFSNAMGSAVGGGANVPEPVCSVLLIIVAVFAVTHRLRPIHAPSLLRQ
jgi:hypothetical protein